MRLSFLGATGTVTGSKYLIEHLGRKYLIDCGLFQGYKELRLRNWDKLPVAPNKIDAVILTHAHIDHSGYIPLLVKNGFRGKIYATHATFDLCKILLPDSGYLQEEDAKRSNKYGYTKHTPAIPLYTQDDAERSLEYFDIVPLGDSQMLDEELSFSFNRAGHILGSAFVTLNSVDSKIVFSGDLGRPNDPMMKPPAEIQEADYLVVESTYGNRVHSETDPADELEEVINSTVKHGGVVVVPAFAVGRAQSLLYLLWQLKSAGRLPKNLPIYLDSPMAIDATKLLHEHHQEHRLPKSICESVCKIATYVNTPEESKRINAVHCPSVIISASGMATGGRVLHHIKHYADDNRNTILFTGYQAGGTRGEKILAGEKTVKIHGEQIPIRARVAYLNNMSAHADCNEIMQWLSHFRSAPRNTFITHGEPDAALAMKERIETDLKWRTTVPEYLSSIDL